MTVTREEIIRTLSGVRDLLTRLLNEIPESIAPLAGSELVMAGDTFAFAGGG